MVPLKVLLVEDSNSDAGLLMRALRRSGFDTSFHRVETAADMAAALESLEWDVVISDYNLPEFAAPSALTVLQAANYQIPFIVVSGNIGEDSAVNLMKRGASDYILKSSLTRLPAVVQRELAEFETRRQLKRSEAHLRLAAKVFESSREAIVITDAQRRIVSVNRAFAEITGHQSEDVLDQSIAILNASVENHELLKNMWSEVAAHGFWQGEVSTKRKFGSDYPIRLSITSVKDEQGIDQNYVLVATDITEHKHAIERINYLAHFDVLTDLPNRVSMQGRLTQILAQAKVNGTKVSVLFVDLDRFKAINDSLGHHAGDAVLQGVARCRIAAQSLYARDRCRIAVGGATNSLSFCRRPMKKARKKLQIKFAKN